MVGGADTEHVRRREQRIGAQYSAGIVEIRALLRELACEQGVTIFMSSHILGEVARLVSGIGIIPHLLIPASS